MKSLFKNHYKKILIVGDLMLIPAWIFCEWLSDRMLATNSLCVWARIGGKCVTCGGTHFVNSLLNFQFAEAWQHNEFLFILALYLVISLLLLNLYLLFDSAFAKKALRLLYNIPALILWLAGLILFLLVRNIPLWERLAQALILH